MRIKNLIPLLFWAIIGGSIVNTDNISHIKPFNGYEKTYSVIFFNTKGIRQYSIVAEGTPIEVWRRLSENRIRGHENN
jgi:hypothetical protein